MIYLNDKTYLWGLSIFSVIFGMSTRIVAIL